MKNYRSLCCCSRTYWPIVGYKLIPEPILRLGNYHDLIGLGEPISLPEQEWDFVRRDFVRKEEGVMDTV